jgi:hypothetical protein
MQLLFVFTRFPVPIAQAGGEAGGKAGEGHRGRI